MADTIDYIQKLEIEEINRICQMIGGRLWKKFFSDNPKVFSGICHGFRANSLTDDKAVSLAFKNYEKTSISAYINYFINMSIKTMDEYKARLIGQGETEGKAIVKCLRDGSFKDGLDLYFKLIDADEETYFNVLQAVINEVPEENENEPVDEGIATQAIAEDFVEKAEYERVLEENEQLNMRLNEAISRISGLEEVIEEKESIIIGANTQLQELQSRFEIPVPEKEYCMEGYQYASLCRVIQADEGIFRLLRLADIDSKTGEIRLSYLEDAPTRNKLYKKDGPSELDFIGVWCWRCSPNKNDPSKDYIETVFSKECFPVEVIVLPDCRSIKDIINSLKAGVEVLPSTEQTLFVYQGVNNQYIGVLCNSGNFDFFSDSVRVKGDVITLPEYQLLSTEVITIQNKKFYYRLKIGSSKGIVNVKNNLEVVRNAILPRLSWTAMKHKGLIKAQWQKLSEVISDLVCDDLYDEISSMLQCSRQDAISIVNDFTSKVNGELLFSTVESDIIYQIIQNNDVLLKRCSSLIKNEWEQNNTEYIQEMQITRQAKEEALSGLTAEYELKRKEYEKLVTDIEERERLARDVEMRVAERIQKARDDAADFIAQQAFIGIPERSIVLSQMSYNYTAGSKLSEENIESYSSTDDLVYDIASELEEAGVASAFSKYFAAFLYSAYVNKSPVLLLGPNGKAIADAFSAAMFGSLCGRFNCCGQFDKQALNEIETSQEQIIIIEDLFASEWNRHLNWFSQVSNKFLIAVNPYVEDIVIEPNGILNYWVPIITEWIVDKQPGYSFIGAVAKDYKKYESAKKTPVYSKEFKQLKIKDITKNKIQQILTDAAILNGEKFEKADYMLAIMPCAYVLDSVEILRGLIEKTNNVDLKNFFNDTFGEE